MHKYSASHFNFNFPLDISEYLFGQNIEYLWHRLIAMVWLLFVQFYIDDVPFSLDFHLRYKFLIHEENISSWSASHYVPTQTSNKHSNFLFKNGRPCHACTKFFCKMFKMVYHFYSEERISAGHAWRKVCMTSRIRINMDPLQRYNKKICFFWKLSCLSHFEVSLYSNFSDLYQVQPKYS